jgi:hypothetical protein
MDDPKNTEDRVVEVKTAGTAWGDVSTKDSGKLPVSTQSKAEVKTEKVLRLDHVIVLYNTGIGAYNAGRPKGDATAVCKARGENGINCKYIKSILGTDGTLDILVP